MKAIVPATIVILSLIKNYFMIIIILIIIKNNTNWHDSFLFKFEVYKKIQSYT